MNNCILKFGSSQTTPLPLITLPSGLFGADPLTIATLRLNTARTNNSCVKLDFVTNFNVFGITAGTIKFQVFKRFDNQENAIPVGAPWTFGPIAIGYEPISFYVHDCDLGRCSNCSGVTYSVEVSAAELAVAELGYASFANSMLTATICDNGGNSSCGS